MKYVRYFNLILAFVVSALIYSCDKNGDLLLFSIQSDIDLGSQVASEIAADPVQFPVLSRSKKPEAYAVLDEMLADILNSDAVSYKDEFEWKLTIIDDDETLNAFATPGGHLYVYTGLIFFLDKLDDLAGVIGHEVAHSDQRHSSKQLQRTYGISLLLKVIAGNSSDLTQKVLGGLVGVGALKFSRDAETEADKFSVEYLSDTKYACNGAAAFFEKLTENEASRNPEFLSTHPNPPNRVESINSKSASIGCTSSPSDPDGAKMDALQAFIRN